MKALLWDLDGTLTDSEPAHAAAFDAALSGLGLSVGPAFHAGCLGASEDMVHAALVAESALSLGLEEWRALKWGHYRELAAQVAPTAAAALVAPLAAAGVPMAVVSNSTRDEVDLALAAVGLASLLPITISRADVSRGKPDPEGYLAAALRLGFAPADCIVVEDSPAGATAGLAAGMTTLFVPQEPALATPPMAWRTSPDGLAALLARLGLPGTEATGGER